MAISCASSGTFTLRWRARAVPIYSSAIAFEEVETNKITKRKYAVHQLNGNRRKGQFQKIYGNFRK